MAIFNALFAALCNLAKLAHGKCVRHRMCIEGTSTILLVLESRQKHPASTRTPAWMLPRTFNAVPPGTTHPDNRTSLYCSEQMISYSALVHLGRNTESYARGDSTVTASEQFVQLFAAILNSPGCPLFWYGNPYLILGDDMPRLD